MPANLRRTFSLTEDTDDLIEFYIEKFGMTASEANRLAWESAIMNDRNIRRDHLLIEEKKAKARLEKIQTELKQIDDHAPDVSKGSVLERYSSPQKTEARPSMTDEELFQSYHHDILKDTPTGKIARKRVRGLIEKHPEMKNGLTAEEIRRLEA